MFKRLSLIALAAALILATGYADQSKGKIVIPVNRTNPTNGKLMYDSYCAPCHGVDGRGNGPAASALKTQPTDLTVLAKANHGKYPDSHIAAVLHFGSSIPAHGSAQMPVWGTVLGRMENGQRMQSTLRISNLSRYLESMQAR
ncbi:MAG TPA: c-type cytochrome [Terracidiphilus sp.]|nr:c-type cytochrome [Terracidiphilus sp.]